MDLDLHSPLLNRDTTLFQLLIAFKKLSFDCLDESLNSRQKEADSFASLQSSLSRSATKEIFFLAAFFLIN